MKILNKSKGDNAEQLAAEYLKKNGYKILETNYRSPYGEIDIIGEIGRETVFVEVKYRSSSDFGAGYEAVNSKKCQKIIKTAQIYMNEKNISGSGRFDVISIDKSEINHIENAFSL